jgi:AraC family transcriptional regulator, regulatory protein of adaptative response / methylated-DNA-[protein]-cysteine methyltransferase
MGRAGAELAEMKNASDVVDATSAWKSVLARNADADGEFVFAVKTTGIFCRPSCPAKRPKRENVQFFPSAEIASASGYRACKRCRPELADRTLGERRVRAAAKYLDAHAAEPLSLDALAAQVKLSPFHLQREFKRLFGVSPRGYQAAGRVARLKRRLDAGDSVSRATYEAGFGSSRAVYESSGKGLGMTPGKYRRGGKGMQISYTFADSTLGKILVAGTEKGVCAVSIGNDAPALEAELRAKFPAAAIDRAALNDSRMRRWSAAVIAIAEGRISTSPPVDVDGTAFQMRVWESLRQIPLGKTKSYSEIASELGASGASRAVGSACGKNPVALIIPCHRALRKGGDPGGYRWGVERKLELLEKERRFEARR